MTLLLVVELLPLLFGLWFFFFIKEKLLYYYDIDKISNYGDGVFRMNIPGVSLNNRNWLHVLRAGRAFCFITPVIYPVIYLLLTILLKAINYEEWIAMINLPVGLMAVLGGLFIPMVVVGRKYE